MGWIKGFVEFGIDSERERKRERERDIENFVRREKKERGKEY